MSSMTDEEVRCETRFFLFLFGIVANFFILYNIDGVLQEAEFVRTVRVTVLSGESDDAFTDVIV